jgi:signal transduction histidine kinase
LAVWSYRSATSIRTSSDLEKSFTVGMGKGSSNQADRLTTEVDTNRPQVSVGTQELGLRNAEVLQQAKQLRELSNRLLQRQDEERRRIARELHDSAGQILTALGIHLASITHSHEPT